MIGSKCTTSKPCTGRQYSACTGVVLVSSGVLAQPRGNALLRTVRRRPSLARLHLAVPHRRLLGVLGHAVEPVGEVIAHPQTQALGMLQDTGAGISLTGLPLSFDGERPALRNIAPDLPDRNKN